MGGAPQVPPVGQPTGPPRPRTGPPPGPPQAPPQGPPQQAPRAPVTPMDPEVQSQGAWTALARIPGVGQKGSERGASNVRRRRL